MIILRSLNEFRIWRNSIGTQKVGFVPTMGALHEGHLSLVKLAKKNSDYVIVSLFVNPLQFGPHEDFSKYPRTFDRDRALLEFEECDVLFFPEASEITPQNSTTFVTEESVSAPLCGQFRPGHFRGVTTIVLKLFNIVQPHQAFFGQKDAQQCAVIERMVRDLNLPIQIIRGATLREKDGLAMSSRNTYLSPSEREVAPKLYESLTLVRAAFEAGMTDVANLEKIGLRHLENYPQFKIQYFEIRDLNTLERTDKITSSKMIIAVAAYLGKTRLIDNLIINERVSQNSQIEINAP